MTVTQEDKDKSDDQEDDGDRSGYEDENVAWNLLTVHILLQSIMRWTSPTSMKLKGATEGKEIVILVDSGASHNDLSSALIKSL